MDLFKIIRNVRHTIDTSDCSVLITDADGAIVYANDAFCRFTGYQEYEVLGTIPRLFNTRYPAAGAYAVMWQTILSGKIWSGDFQNYKKNGDAYWERTLVLPIVSTGTKKNSHYIVVREDITEYKEIELQQEDRHKKIRQDLQLANMVQRSFLPMDISNKQFCLKSFFEASNEVSGDYFDYEWRKNTLTGYILDVMGHGVAAALQGSGLRVLSRRILHSSLPLNRRMHFLNKRSFELLSEDSFAGLIMFEFDFSEHKLSYVTAGINYFLRGCKDGVQIIKGPGVFLGLMEDAQYGLHQIPFSGGDSFCFMSDGLFDGLNREILKTSDLEMIFKRLVDHKSGTSDDSTGIFIKIKR